VSDGVLILFHFNIVL